MENQKENSALDTLLTQKYPPKHFRWLRTMKAWMEDEGY